jgi:thiosulfate/3-mercaptopyruvate sulfurtransferase
VERIMAAYADPNALVDSAWVAEHLHDPKVRILEIDYDPAANYAMGHLPGAGLVDWRKDINDGVQRDLVSASGLQAVLERLGCREGDRLVLYGDFNNWFAAFGYWVFEYYGIRNVALMNGGRKKWIAEDRPLTNDVPSLPKGHLPLRAANEKLRAYQHEVRELLGEVQKGKIALVDVRGPKEFTGEVLAPPEYPTEHAQRGGHIPGAKNIPWGQAVNDDGTFKSRPELEALYHGQGVKSDRPVITYCRIGERSSHTWFVLTHLLGYPNVRNYDGSWTEWGNVIRSPIEKP